MAKITTTNEPTRELDVSDAELASLKSLGIVATIEGKPYKADNLDPAFYFGGAVAGYSDVAGTEVSETATAGTATEPTETKKGGK